MKFCRCCAADKPENDFGKKKASSDKLQPWCRECTRKYYKANKQRTAARKSQLYHENPAPAKARAANHQKENPESKRQNQKKYHQSHKGKESRRKKKWYKQNKLLVKIRLRRWRKKNPQKSSDQVNRRRARMREVAYEVIDRKLVYCHDEGQCHLCKKPVAKDNFHLDHVIPLSKGGGHLYDNVKVAHPSCNLKKSNKLTEVA